MFTTQSCRKSRICHSDIAGPGQIVTYSMSWDFRIGGSPKPTGLLQVGCHEQYGLRPGQKLLTSLTPFTHVHRAINHILQSNYLIAHLPSIYNHCPDNAETLSQNLHQKINSITEKKLNKIKTQNSLASFQQRTRRPPPSNIRGTGFRDTENHLSITITPHPPSRSNIRMVPFHRRVQCHYKIEE